MIGHQLLLRDIGALEEALALDPMDTLARLAYADALEEGGWDEESAWERLLVQHAARWPAQHLFPLPSWCWRRLEERQGSSNEPRYLAILATLVPEHMRTAQMACCTFFREGDERGPLGVLLGASGFEIWKPSGFQGMLWARQSHGHSADFRDYGRLVIGLMPSCEMSD